MDNRRDEEFNENEIPSAESLSLRSQSPPILSQNTPSANRYTKNPTTSLKQRFERRRRTCDIT